jgi:hypothetical protein
MRKIPYPLISRRFWPKRMPLSALRAELAELEAEFERQEAEWRSAIHSGDERRIIEVVLPLDRLEWAIYRLVDVISERALAEEWEDDSPGLGSQRAAA